MSHICNICGAEMTEVDDIIVRGFQIHGWRCQCGNSHSNAEDVDKIVKFFRFLKTTNGELSVFKSGNSLAVRIPKPIAEIYHITANSKIKFVPESKEIILRLLDTPMG